MAALIGRDAELETLKTALDDAARGVGNAQLLVGEPGIGKSRLLDETRSLANRRQFGVAGAGAVEGSPPLWLLRQALRAIVQIQHARETVIEDVLGVQGFTDPVATALLRAEQIAGLLSAFSSPSPLLIWFDDLHEADDATLRTLDCLVQACRDAPIMWLLASRSEPWLPLLGRLSRRTRIIRPARFSMDDVHELVKVRHGDDPSLSAAIWQRAQGLPLFTVELVADGKANALPGSVRELVNERVRRLSAAALGIIEAAAVIGDRPNLTLLAPVVRMPPELAFSRVQEAVAAGLLVDPGGLQLGFSHPLMREAILESLPLRARLTWHQRIAEQLLVQDPSGRAAGVEIALQSLSAVPLIDAHTAAERARRAAEYCFHQGAPSQAAELLERALSVLAMSSADPSIRVELLTELAEAAAAAGDRDATRRAVEEVLRLATQPSQMVRAALVWGHTVPTGVVDSTLVHWLEQALPRIPDDDPALKALCLARLAAALQPALDPEPPMAMALEAVQMARASQSRDALLWSLAAAASALDGFAPLASRLETDEELVQLVQVPKDRLLALRAHARLVPAYLESGDVAAARRSLAAYRALAVASHPTHRWRGLLLEGLILMALGHFRAAMALNDEALQIAEEANDREGLRSWATQRMSILSQCGSPDDLIALATKIETYTAGQGSPLLARLIRASIEASFGRLERAHEALARIKVDDPALRNSAVGQAYLADLIAALGDRQWAQKIWPLCPDEAGFVTFGVFGLGFVGARARAHGLLARTAGEYECALSVLQRARAQALDAGYAPTAAVLALDASSIARALGQARLADELLADATRSSDDLGMPALKAGISRLLDPGFRAVTTKPKSPGPKLTRLADAWEVDLDGRTARLPAVRGFEMLARLLEAPGVEWKATDLEGIGEATGDAGEAIDQNAAQQYRTRLAHIDAELAELDQQSFDTTDRREMLKDEREALLAELSRGLGLGRRPRRVGALEERARINVTRRLRDAIRRVAEVEPLWGAALDRCVRTGNICVYRPEPDALERLGTNRS